ncbi:porin opacity type [Actinobacillus minor 202]|uniref:Porin opacity type n=1 Tax=Actinobacillus minor 202 TaxID=591023 RepID=A0ABP2GTE6_9PAST|nr:opacity family porin [Actinobacillus minor]EEV24989.1 porin opacity type [Actinobacillus minor 202]
MKKTIFALALSTFALSATASATNWYAEGNLGYSKVKTSGLAYSELNDSAFTPSVAVGYRLNDLRFALDYTHYGKASDSYVVNADDSVISNNFDLKIQSVGFSALYDIDLGSSLKPYVGVRLALNKIKENSNYTEVSTGYTERGSESESYTKVGYGAVLGATYDLTPNWAVNANIEYNRLGKVDDVKINQYGTKIGVRYSF